MHPNSEASSLITGGAWADKTETLKVRSVDVVQFFIQHISPYDHNILRIDIEGAEYEVLRVMISTGLGCWLSVAELEFHSIHHKQNYNKRPLDVAYAWMLRQCGVLVSVGNFYPEHMYRPDDQYCKNCEMLNDGVLNTE